MGLSDNRCTCQCLLDGPVEYRIASKSDRSDTMAIAVVGAHLRGFPLNKDLTCRGALFLQLTKTSANYRLFALQNTEPRKPGLRRAIAGESGRPIEVEVWRLPKAQFGEFMDTVKFPLGIGQVELQDHSWIHGFVCEYAALAGTLDITEFGGWRAYTNNLTLPASSGAFRTCD